jgi:hypothetical protein
MPNASVAIDCDKIANRHITSHNGMWANDAAQTDLNIEANHSCRMHERDKLCTTA